MPSLIMERGGQKLQNITEDGLSRDLINAGRFCFSCEQIFSDRKSLEEHVCSSASHICSCGTEFTKYNDMLDHSTTHEPGHQVLDHETIKKRRIEKRIEEEEKMKRLQTGEIIWEIPKINSSFSHVPTNTVPENSMLKIPTSAHMSVPMQSEKISQVPELCPTLSQASFLPNPVTSSTEMQNIFAGVGAPTVDLWTLYQPVVLLKTVDKFNPRKPYRCAKCGQCFASKISLISHHSTHVTDKVSGCIGCGLLLSSKKVVPRFHVCNSPSTATKFRLITAEPLNYKRVSRVGTDRSQNTSTQEPPVPSSILLKRQNPTKNIQPSCVTSILQLKNQNVRIYAKTHSPNRSMSAKRNLGLSGTAMQVRVPTHAASGVSSRPLHMSSVQKGFACRVCYIAFDTAQMLQRHKCIKAQEFMAQQGRGGKQHYRLKRVTPMPSPIPNQIHFERRLEAPTAGNLKRNQVKTVSLDRRQGSDPVNGKTLMTMDDDCYIVETDPGKPAELIYQVTSSVSSVDKTMELPAVCM
ncbi:zinc finger protein 84-like isoform X2 [Echeneis naucrates]|uniref:zinc finger protein 84-like isoform X2 n=1 Tax=Echeneis naucrates TaxID=173247 RepID=UPI001113333B|nr:zinc finger protein 84-like isoform X2 [Echeneis naucrates]